MAKPAPSKSHVWIEKIGKMWILRLEFAAEAGLPLSLVVIAAGSFSKGPWLLNLGFVLLALVFVGFFIWSFCYYHFIRCPQCGHNPTRTKEGKRKKNFRASDAQLSKLTHCPKCGT